jgi:acetone carboxylase gamma subunit
MIALPKIYQSLPSLKPFIGINYATSKKKLLIVGESHYFTHPEDKKKLDPEIWYKSTEEKLSILWHTQFITSFIVKDFIDPEKPHSSNLNIYNHLTHALNNVIYGEDNGAERSTFNKVAFFNFFQRPATDGNSLKYESKDIEVAKEVLEYNLSQLNPDLVILASSKVSRIAYPMVRDHAPNIEQIAIPHPASSWWNREVSWLNGMRTKDFVIKFLNDNNWG